jgi:hypothetical protein
MRNTASFVRNAFGLDKFSHSTISRALKKLSTIVDTLSDIISGHVNNNEEDKKLVERKNSAVSLQNLEFIDFTDFAQI